MIRGTGKARHKPTAKSTIHPVSALARGALIGGGSALLLAFGFLLVQDAARDNPRREAEEGPTASPTQASLVVRIPDLNPIPTLSYGSGAFSSQFGAAYEALRQGQPEFTVSIITTVLLDLTDTADFVIAYTLMAEAEYSAGHFKRAAAYYDLLFEHSADVETLFRAAHSYDLGGDIDRALERYMALIQRPDAGVFYTRLAEDGMARIIRVIGTPTPRP